MFYCLELKFITCQQVALQSISLLNPAAYSLYIIHCYYPTYMLHACIICHNRMQKYWM